MALVADSQRPKGLLFNAGFARIAKGDGLICLVAVERAQRCTSSSAFRCGVHTTGAVVLGRVGMRATSGLHRSHLRRSCGCWAFRHALIVSHSQQVGLLHIRSGLLSFRPAAVSSIFFTVDRGHMRRILIEIGSPDSKLLPACIDPFPEAFSGNPSLGPCCAFDAHDIGRKTMAVAAAEAPAMVRPVSRRLQAACDRLTVVIAERAGYARRQPGLLRRAKR